MEPIWKLKSIKEAATRSEFYSFMNVALKTLLFKAYRMTPTTYQKLVRFEDSTKAKEGYPSLGSAGLPVKVGEGEPFPERNIPKSDFVEITNFKFGEIMAITQELIDDDQTSQIRMIPSDLGKAHAKFEDKTVYSVINGNPAVYDSQLFFSLNHPGYTGGPAIGANDNIYTNVTMTANAIAVVIGMISLWRGHVDDDILDVSATDLVVPANLLHTANILTQSEFIGLAYAAGVLGPGAATAQARNPIRNNGLGVISSPRLDATSGLDWYVKTDFPGLVFQWRQRLKVLQEDERSGERFSRDVNRWKSKVRFGFKVVNWRGMLKVS